MPRSVLTTGVSFSGLQHFCGDLFIISSGSSRIFTGDLGVCLLLF